MAKSTFEDHLHRIPESGVPYAPAWDGDDARCVAWMAYRPECDLLRVRVGDMEREVLRADAVGKPATIQTAADEWQVAAPVCEEDAWSCRRFRVTADGFTELPPLAESGGFIETVRLLSDGAGGVLAALTREAPGGARATLLRASGDAVEELLGTPANLSAYRPTAVLFQGEPALVFDAWDGAAYGVYLQTAEGVTRLSDASSKAWHLAADAGTGDDGALYAAWIRDTDVMNPEGVADARCELMAVRVTARDGAIQVQSFGAIDDLSHGLMDLSPDPQGVWGYCGRRRHPMLLNTPEGMRVLWEQKEIHNGPTRQNRGVLWSRQLNASGASDAVALAEGALYYEIAGSHRAGSSPAVACYEGMFTDERRIVYKTLSDAPLQKTRLPREAWRGWRPVTLPLPVMAQPERPAIEVDGKTYSLYWFDLHCHTALSGDAAGEVDECYRTARRKAAIDGVLVTDNDHYVVPLNHNEWRTNCALADAFTAPGEFVGLIGYEWTCRREVNGQLEVDHRSVLLPKPTKDIVRWNEVGSDLEPLYDFVKREGGFTHAHHQVWHLLGDPMEVNIEAASSWEPYLERRPEVYNDALKAGRRIGVIGGSDEHRRNPGLGGALTGVWAESLTRESVLDALRNRRCLATTGHRVMVDLRVNGRPMGETVRANEVNLSLRVEAPVGIRSVELIRDGEVVETWPVEGARAFSTERTERLEPGEHFYYVKASLEGVVLFRETLPSNLQQLLGPRAWTSPVWVRSGE